MSKKSDCKEIIVTIAHPFGDVDMPLETWIERGPPKGRPLVRPRLAKCGETGEYLPLNVIPLHYRNTLFVNLLFKLGILKSPW